MTWTAEQQRVYHREWSKRNRQRIKAYPSRSIEVQRVYWKEWATRNPDKVRAQNAKHREENRDKLRARVAVFNLTRGKEYTRRYRERNRAIVNSLKARYRASVLQSTPAWADMTKIEAVYNLALIKTQSSGVAHQVDHYYPLQGKLVCGLHVENNLRVITKSENCSKRNRMPL